MIGSLKKYLFEIILFGIITFSISSTLINKHKHVGEFNWQAELWADQVGYYSFLPAFFVYDYDGHKLPNDIVEKTGGGFTVDSISGKIKTRYTYGVALMQAPFFGLVHLHNKIKGLNIDGFSGNYHNIPNYATLFYGILGLILLYFFLQTKVGKVPAAISIITILLGTNLFYYLTDTTGMSHSYSFFCFTAVLFFSKKIDKSLFYFSIWFFFSMLTVIIRPINGIFILAVIAIMISHREKPLGFIKSIFSLKNILAVVLIGFIVILPQLLYWHYLSGSLIHDSYQGESFTNLTSPKLIEFWFSFNNGVFTYNPIYLILIPIFILLALKRENSGIVSLFVFLLVSYLCASWYSFSFGCGYGSRNFVEYTALFSIPLAAFIKHLTQSKWFLKALFIFPTLIFIIINQLLISNYEKCFFGEDNWDKNEYTFLLTRHSKKASSKKEELISTTQTYGSSVVLETDYLNKIHTKWVDLNISLISYTNNNPQIVCSIEKNDSTYFWKSFSLKENIGTLGTETTFHSGFIIPKDIPKNSQIKIYVLNENKDSLLVKNIDFSMR